MQNKNLIAVAITAVIVSNKPDGYRRANIAFNKGDNDVEVSPAQLAQIETDPNLLVKSTQAIEDADQKGPMGDDQLGNGIDKVEIDLSGAPEELAVFIAGIHELAKAESLKKKPNCDALEVEVTGENVGETIKVKPSGDQRDAAWAWYQENVVNQTNADKA